MTSLLLVYTHVLSESRTLIHVCVQSRCYIPPRPPRDRLASPESLRETWSRARPLPASHPQTASRPQTARGTLPLQDCLTRRETAMPGKASLPRMAAR